MTGYCVQALNSQGLDSERERERVVEEDEGRKTRGGGGARAVGLLLRWRAVKRIIPPSPPTPTYSPARHQPYLTHSDTLFPRLELSLTPPAVYCCTCGQARACVCVLQQTLCCPSTESTRTVLTLNSHRAQTSIVLSHIYTLQCFKVFPHTHAGEDVTGPASSTATV